MKLVSVNAVLIASANISLFVNTYLDYHSFPPLSLFLLSLIFITLIILLQYQHRQFKQSNINIHQSSQLHASYLFLFAGGLFLTFAQKYQWLNGDQHPQLRHYTLLGGSIHYSVLYHGINVGLGMTYQYLFLMEYKKANKNRIGWCMASAVQDQNCTICLNRIEENQKLAKIQCMHLFHLSCMNKWIKQKNCCPLCQCPIQTT